MGGGGGVGVGWKSLEDGFQFFRRAPQPVLAWQEENPTLIIILPMQKSNTLMNDGRAVTTIIRILGDVDDGVGGGKGRKLWMPLEGSPSSSGAYQPVFEADFQNGL